MALHALDTRPDAYRDRSHHAGYFDAVADYNARYADHTPGRHVRPDDDARADLHLDTDERSDLDREFYAVVDSEPDELVEHAPLYPYSDLVRDRVGGTGLLEGWDALTRRNPHRRPVWRRALDAVRSRLHRF